MHQFAPMSLPGLDDSSLLLALLPSSCSAFGSGLTGPGFEEGWLLSVWAGGPCWAWAPPEAQRVRALDAFVFGILMLLVFSS